MSQKLPVDDFKWIDTLLIDKKFDKFTKLIKNYDEESDKGYVLEADILQNYIIYPVVYHFYQKE